MQNVYEQLQMFIVALLFVKHKTLRHQYTVVEYIIAISMHIDFSDLAANSRTFWERDLTFV